MDQKSPKPEQKIEDIELGTRLSRNPAIWFGLLMIPMFFGLLVAFVLPVEETIQPVPAAGATAQGDTAVPAQESAEAPPPALSNTRRVAGQDVVACDFNIWVGRPLNEAEVVRQLDGLKRPYRFLRPGSMMTMDYSPSRVNFDLDEQNVVRRIWCG